MGGQAAEVGAAETRDLIAAMADRIVQAVQPLQVILFGSYARGTPQRWSDVDFLVVIPDVRDKRQARRDSYEALRDSPVPKDVIVTTPDEIARRGDLIGAVLRPALREGRVLYDARSAGMVGGSGRRPIWEVCTVTDEERLAETRLWLRQARADLTAAAALLDNPEVEPDPPCYLAQQAAEKALKAVFVFLQIQYPFTHDLDSIRSRIPEGWRVAEEHPYLKWLSDWAYKARYPGDWEPPTRTDAVDATRSGRAIYETVLRDLRAHGFPHEEDR